ncbi:hypothetical protein [Nocardia thailandica]
MTAEEIRAEAIDRLTVAIREGHEASGLSDGFGGYECRCGQSWASSSLWGCHAWRTAPEVAARYVDVLGDLLPTEIEHLAAYGADASDDRLMQRYVTAWTEVEGS